jgi:hypothetical protein
VQVIELMLIECCKTIGYLMLIGCYMIHVNPKKKLGEILRLPNRPKIVLP